MTKQQHHVSSTAQTLGRIVRGLLTILGWCAFGVGAGALGMYGFLMVTLGELQHDGWGAAPVWLLLMLIGSVVGLIVGLVLAIRRIRYREFDAYAVFDWLGLLVGAAAGVGLTLLFPDRYYLFMQCLFAAAIIPPCATIGRTLFGAAIGPYVVSRSRPLGGHKQ